MSPAAALPQLQRIAAALGNSDNDGVVVDAVERPAEIVNYNIGRSPGDLGGRAAEARWSGSG